MTLMATKSFTQSDFHTSTLTRLISSRTTIALAELTLIFVHQLRTTPAFYLVQLRCRHEHEEVPHERVGHVSDIVDPCNNKSRMSI